MKLLYVGDNRNRVNLGCRGTSIALSQLLREKFDIGDIICGDDISRVAPVLGIIPERISRIIRFRKNKPIFNYLGKLEKKLGYLDDFICENPQESAERLIKNKHKNLFFKKILNKVEDCDILVFNGEGDMIFTTPPRKKLLFLLMVMELANILDKPVFYINAMVSEDPLGKVNQKTLNTSIKYLEKCSLVALRDPQSFDLVKSFNADINAYLIPDALFTWNKYYAGEFILPSNGDFIIPHPESNEYFGKFDFSKPYICIGGTSSSPNDYADAIKAYTRLVESSKSLGFNIFLIECCDGDFFLEKVAENTGVPFVPANIPIIAAGAILAHSRLFISGRHHPSIFASLGGTPCIFLGSNSHKMKSLQKVLEYKTVREFNSFPTTKDCQEILDLAKDLLEQGDSLRQSIKKTVNKRAEESTKVIEMITSELNIHDKKLFDTEKLFKESLCKKV